MQKNYHNRKKKHFVKGEEKVAKRLDAKYGGDWWYVKKIMLIISAVAVGAGIIYLAFSLADTSTITTVIIGILVGLILLYWTLYNLSRFRVRVTKAVFIPACAVVYAILAFAYLA